MTFYATNISAFVSSFSGSSESKIKLQKPSSEFEMPFKFIRKTKTFQDDFFEVFCLLFHESENIDKKMRNMQYMTDMGMKNINMYTFGYRIDSFI